MWHIKNLHIIDIGWDLSFRILSSSSLGVSENALILLDFFIDGVIFVVILICTATLSLLLLTALNCSFWRASREP